MAPFDLWSSSKDLDAAVRQLLPNPQPDRHSTSHLPPPMQDIIAREDDPLLRNDIENRFYRYMTLRESDWPIRPFYTALQQEVTPSLRSRCVDQMIYAHHAMNFLPDTLFLAVSIMDHYLSVERVANTPTMELLSVGALYVAAKYQEKEDTEWPRRFIDTVDTARMSIAEKKNTAENALQEIKRAELLMMEIRILQRVKWSLARPLPLPFLRRNCQAAKASMKEDFTAKYILEVCLMEHFMSWIKPSKLAAAALHCSLMLSGRLTRRWNRRMEFYSGYSTMALRSLLIRMAKLTLDACENIYMATNEKYRRLRYEYVSCFPEAKARKLRQLANGVC